MNNVTFKLGLPGEGKTRWLLNIAKQYADKNIKVYLFTNDESDYAKFCEKYFKTFSHICPVQRLTAFKITKEDVVLVDDLFDHCDSAVNDFVFLQKNCYKMFVTLTGTTEVDNA